MVQKLPPISIGEQYVSPGDCKKESPTPFSVAGRFKMDHYRSRRGAGSRCFGLFFKLGLFLGLLELLHGEIPGEFSGVAP